MHNKTLLWTAILAAACLAQPAMAAEAAPPASGPDVDQIIEKHVAARGGAKAWHAVQALAVSGKLEAGTGDSIRRSIVMARQGQGASVKRAERAAAEEAARKSAEQQVQLPFRLEMKRPHKSRLEIDFAGKTAVQAYDGQKGWKLRPFLNRDDVEPFTAEEAKAQELQADFEPLLVDYAGKGSQVALEGTDKVDGRDAYRLKVTLKNGTVQHVWIDAQSFLDVKVEGLPRRMDGTMRAVWIYQHDFKSIQGVAVPHVYETANEGNPRRHKMLVESVTVNPSLEDGRFAKPQVLVAATPGTAKPANPAPVKE